MNGFISKIKESTIPQWYIIVLLIIFLARCILIGVSIHNGISPSLPQDPLQYKILATNIYEHGRFTLDVSDVGNHDLLRTPLYPLVIGPMILLDNSGYLVVFFQQIMSLLTAYLIYRIVVYLTKRHHIAAIISLIFFAWPYDVLWSRMTMSETLFTFLLFASAYVIVKRRDRVGDIVGGVLTGAMLLTRPQGMVAFAVMMVYVFITGPKRRMWLYPIIVLLCVAPWLLRNYSLTHSITLSSSGTLNMIFGGVVGPEARSTLEHLDAEKSKMARDVLGANSTTDWWSYTTRGYEPMNELVRNSHTSLSIIVKKNIQCSSKVWSLDQFQVLLMDFPRAIQGVMSFAYVLFLIVVSVIIVVGCVLAIIKRDKDTILLFFLTLGIVASGTLANMCIAYGRMNIPLMPFLLVAVGVGASVVVDYYIKQKEK